MLYKIGELNMHKHAKRAVQADPQESQPAEGQVHIALKHS